MGDQKPEASFVQCGCRPPVGQTFMQAPHLRHSAKEAVLFQRSRWPDARGIGRGSTPSEARMRGKTATTPATPATSPLAPHEIDLVVDSLSGRHEPVGKKAPARAASIQFQATHALGWRAPCPGIGRALAVGPAELAALADIRVLVMRKRENFDSSPKQRAQWTGTRQ